MSRFKVCNWSCSAFICVAMAWSSASMAFCIPLDGGGGAICGGGMNSDNEIGSAITGGAISIAFSNSANGETDSACSNSKGGADMSKGGGEGLRLDRKSVE